MKLERIYTVPLGDAYKAPRNKRAPKAVKILREFVSKHMKADGEKILLSEDLNKLIWEKSIQKPPRRIKVRLIKDEGVINAYLSDEKIGEPKKEEKKPEEKPAEKKEAPKKEEKAPEEKAAEKKEEKPPEKKAEEPKAEKK